MKKGDISGEIVLSSENGERTSLPSIPNTVLEALFNTVTGAKENTTVTRRKAAKVELSDLYQLSEQLHQWVRPYRPISSKLEFVVTNLASDELKGKSRTRYENYDSLSRHEIAKTSPTSSVEVHFSFVFRSDETEKLETIDLVVDLTSKSHQYVYMAKENDLFGFRRLRHLDNDDVTAKIDIRYTNYLVAKGVVGVVDDWYENLKDIELWNPPRFLRLISDDGIYDRFGLPSIFLKVFPVLAALFFVRGVYANFFGSSDVTQVSLTGLLLAAVVVFALIDVVFRTIVRKAEDLTNTIAVQLVQLNTGDSRLHADYEQRKKLGRTSSRLFQFQLSSRL
ncbi:MULTISPECIES: hypothetical protein [unclassified Ruegeria]|uniref:hypothetical protein n=1 Tax=unclassified Ruegeria TaxID=2625375 RepID=UPI001489E5E6|nr:MULTISPECIES: hypothetical protein [unclassified Ruegeria]